LVVWQKAKKLAKEIHGLTNQDLLSRDRILKDQMWRAAVSICSNIAEGDERDTDKEAIHFFYIAKGSAAELGAQLEIAADIAKIHASDAGKSIEACDEIGRMLRAQIVARLKKKAG
jgi:four helix bundle protein